MANVLNKIPPYLLVLILTIFTFGNGIAQQLPKGFVYIKTIVPTIELELRYAGNNNFIGKPIDGYKKAKGITSLQTAMALKKIQLALYKKNLGLKLYDAYRPQQAVNHFVRWAKKLSDTLQKQAFYPTVKKENLFKEKYIASKSGHSRGSTVDITLINLSSKKELDMGSSYDFFGKISWVSNKQLSKKQLKNRRLLQKVMKKYGFNNYPQEWWHFTLKNEPFPNTYFNFPVE